ncbi:MAG TPA: translational GTPase TypA [Phycisphaerales bacterium]|nr:translational GTPase TypA [Phycisphaerales bacterium]HRQ75500.1 translational GTPase TypA [Phycisphaerales bacterium]
MTKTADPFLRNVAIIAHVDHGKTTLVDALLAQSGTPELARGGLPDECILDSNPLERERGITIFSKNCAVNFIAPPSAGDHAGKTFRINIIDTPGHADFGGEVERVLRMADGALLLVDAFEGPMPQTRFVLGKALQLGLRIIVVVNKCDRPEARPDAVVNEVFDLLVELGADDSTLDFKTIYASGRDGWSSTDHTARSGTMTPLFETILHQVPPPTGDPDAPLQLLITTLDYSEYVGRIAIGRVFSGSIKSGQPVVVCKKDGTMARGRVQKLHRFEGLGRREWDEIQAGDLCAVEGLAGFDIGDTIASPENPRPMSRVAVDEPTLHMIFRINDSPFVGKEGKYVTSRQIGERLQRELQSNVALRVEPGDSAEEFRVSGRGLLHLGVLLENMRREGFELSVGRPEVIEKIIDGERHEPIENLTLDTSTDGMGAALELLGSRGAEIKKVDARGSRMHIEAEIPARGLIGLRSRMLTATGGEAVMHHTFLRYAPVRTVNRKRINGVLIATDTGTATSYALLNLADRGIMFVRPGDPVYAGQIVGEHSRDNDLIVNVVKAKAFSNMREANKEATVTLKAPRLLTLESALEYLEADELVEMTPKSIRLRKRILSESDRKKIERAEKDRAKAIGVG